MKALQLDFDRINNSPLLFNSSSGIVFPLLGTSKRKGTAILS